MEENNNAKEGSVPSYLYHTMCRDMSVQRGTTPDGSIMLYSWDVVQECIGDDCPAYLICKFKKVGRCYAQTQYLRAISSVVFRNYQNLTEPQLYRIGMHLVPLYKTLIRLKIEELGVTSVLYTDGRGNKRVNPLFKEIRETIKTIESTWKTIGLEVDVEEPGGDVLDGEGEIEEDFYDRMEAEAQAKGKRSKIVNRGRKK